MEWISLSRINFATNNIYLVQGFECIRISLRILMNKLHQSPYKTHLIRLLDLQITHELVLHIH